MEQSKIVDERKISRNILVFWTVIYAILLIPAFLMAWIGSLTAYGEHAFVIGILYIVLFFGLFLSLPLSIYLMWANYFRDRLTRSHFAWVIPLIALAIEVAMEHVLRLM
ncbi:MAG: hypothetical protein FJZ59_02965 [Chlamydiae bacterium]|jgi:hypothetical protein|nr:hypothetical protein [Chlamydiota bacterium]